MLIAVTKAACSFAVGNVAASGAAPARAALLAREVLAAMRLGAIKTAATVLLIAVLAAAFVGVYAFLSQDSSFVGWTRNREAAACADRRPSGPAKGRHSPGGDFRLGVQIHRPSSFTRARYSVR